MKVVFINKTGRDLLGSRPVFFAEFITLPCHPPEMLKNKEKKITDVFCTQKFDGGNQSAMAESLFILLRFISIEECT